MPGHRIPQDIQSLDLYMAEKLISGTSSVKPLGFCLFFERIYDQTTLSIWNNTKFEILCV